MKMTMKRLSYIKLPLQEYFEKRDEHATKQMWRLIFALVAVVGIIALSTFGFTQIPGITRLFKIGG